MNKTVMYKKITVGIIMAGIISIIFVHEMLLKQLKISEEAITSVSITVEMLIFCGVICAIYFLAPLPKMSIESRRYNVLVIGFLLISLTGYFFCINFEIFRFAPAIGAMASIILSFWLRTKCAKDDYIMNKNILLSTKIFVNVYNVFISVVYGLEERNVLFSLTTVVSAYALIQDLNDFYNSMDKVTPDNKICKNLIYNNNKNEIAKVRRMANYGNIQEKVIAFYTTLCFPIKYGILEFPTSSHNIDCVEKLYDKFGNCNKKEMFTYWMYKHQKYFEQICKNCKVNLRKLSETLFLLYNDLTEDGLAECSNMKFKIEQNFVLHIENLIIQNEDFCNAMCAAAEEFIKENKSEIIPWEKLICDNEKTEDRIKISAITSRK